jgi:isoquinoline 1-oxidoreductase subunit alpha
MANLIINGATYGVDAAPDMPLLWARRDLLNLTGAKHGCRRAACGACTVHLYAPAKRPSPTRPVGL